MQRNRRGSALLIVLGFLSFMVVSAVAFSIYMRSERMPSSVFRRNTQTRHLVKAALAHAMSEIDGAIRDDVYPGLVTDQSRQMNRQCAESRYNGPKGRLFDLWQGRVFMPPNPDTDADGKGDPSYAADPDETVSVLNLEALGYLPPPLVNDVRFLARGSWSSKWRSFDYGAGRFAYCAVNVSDFIDINRVPADEPRSSGSRINLASFFADNYDNKNGGASMAGQFASFVDARTGVERSDWPFVSMLDYALGMRSGKAGLESPFFRWLGQSSSDTMYKSEDDNARDQLFVTDSWMPPTPEDTVAASSIVDLNDMRQTDKSGQPFPSQDWMKGRKTYQQIKNNAGSDFVYRVGAGRTPDGKNVAKSFSPVDIAMLYDYLDIDDVPISLALPCVERVPMITGVSLEGLAVNLEPDPNVATKIDSSNADFDWDITDIKVNAASLANMKCDARVSFLFPFKRSGADLNSGNFVIRAMLRVFLVADGASGLRVKGDIANLHPVKGSDEWESSAFTLEGVSPAVPPFVLTLVSEGSCSLPGKVATEDNAAFERTLRFNAPAINGDMVLLTKRQKVPVTVVKTETGTVRTRGQPTEPPEWRFGVAPFNKDGSLIAKADFVKQEDLFKGLDGGFKMQAALWISLENKDGDVVDFVPALAVDDNIQNGIDNSGVAMDGYDGSDAGTPLLRFSSAQGAVTQADPNDPGSIFKFAGSSAANIDHPKAYFAVDPRFNWAPEDYLPVDKQATANNWLTWILESSENGMDGLLGNDGHDPDIFMFTSNQGFLQSMGEFAFLPRLTDFGDQSLNENKTPTEFIAGRGGYDGVEKTVGSCTWRDVANVDCVWCTYRSYETAGVRSDRLLDFRNYVDGSKTGSKAFKEFGVRGFRVNPYTDNNKIRMAAFAYTPYDWMIAATNAAPWLKSDTSKYGKFRQKLTDSDLESSRDYTFNGNTSGSKIKDDELRKIANEITTMIRENCGKSWEDVYDNLIPWYGNPDRPENFLGVNLSEPLHGVDRKFLHAFWRGCFANRQQLFLVFLRAESMALGGTGEGQIPPQQGGRAVALVWRDPEDPCNASGSRVGQDGQTDVRNWIPHRMRVLFFHQFD